MARVNGTVKFFNHSRGFGFIQPEDGGKDVFVHASALERSGVPALNEGDKVSFEIEDDRRGRGKRHPPAPRLARFGDGGLRADRAVRRGEDRVVERGGRRLARVLAQETVDRVVAEVVAPFRHARSPSVARSFAYA